MHLCGSTGWVEVVLVRPSWTTASRHGVVAHHRYERASPANRGQPCNRKIDHSHQSRRTRHALVTHKLPRIHMYTSREFRIICNNTISLP
jgi:hypothetical protein